MRIKRCYINAFGSVSNKEIVFNNLNVFLGDNGIGKTTVAAFIKAMFYGLGKGGNKFNERKHYLPFDGKECGGSIEFELNNDIYKIERSFFSNSKLDTLKVYKNNKESKELGSVPGEKIFNLDEESFDRTLYVSSRDLEIRSSEDIKSKISGFISDTSEDFDLEKVKDKLEEAKKNLNGKRNANSIISNLESSISEINDKIKNILNIKESLQDKYKLLDELNHRVVYLKNEISKASKVNVAIENWENKEKLEEEIKGINDKLEMIKEKYKDLLVDNIELIHIEEIIKDKNEARIAKDNIKFTEVENDEYLRLKKLFEVKPSVEVINSVENKIKVLNSNESISFELASSEKELIGKYSEYVDSNKADIAYGKYSEIVSILNKEMSYKRKDSINVISIILAILGIGVIVGGVIFTLDKLAILLSLLGAGVLCIIFSIFIYFNSKLHSSNYKIKQKYQIELDKLNNEISLFLAPFGFSSEKNGSLEAAYGLFKGEYDRYLEAKNKYEELENKKKENNEGNLLLRKEIKDFFDQYELKEDFTSNMTNLKMLLDRYNGYEIKLNYLTNDISNKNRIIEEKEYKIKEFKNKYNIDGDIEEYLKNYNIDYGQYTSLSSSLMTKENELKEFIKDKKIKNKPSDEYIDANELQDELEEVNKRINVLGNEIFADEVEVEKLEDLEASLEEKQEKLEQSNYKYKIIDNTLLGLIEARDSLKNQYVMPMKEKFNKYAKLLNFSLGDEVIMDNDFNLLFEKNGKNRDYNHLSLGQITMASLCYRLAAIDNIFKDSNFLVLDDVFVNLDENNMKYVLDLLKKLSLDRQIIYFTCHKSRALDN